MKTVLFALFIACTLQLNAQTTQDTSQVEVVEYPDEQAHFPGGHTEMFAFIMKNIEYPDSLNDYVGMGKIYISFIVNADGTIADVKVIRGSHEKIEKMVQDLFAKMPDWVPAKTEGVPVRSLVHLPMNLHFD